MGSAKIGTEMRDGDDGWVYVGFRGRGTGRGVAGRIPNEIKAMKISLRGYL